MISDGEDTPGFQPFHLITKKCNERFDGDLLFLFKPTPLINVNNSFLPVQNETTACSCVDCEESCPAFKPIPDGDTEFILLGTEGMIVVSIILCILIL
ncbi:hypothetical protein J437_LFUL004893, partial [Ladona fulva]